MSGRFRQLADIAVRNELGEGILWDDRAGMFSWTDIQRKTFYRLAFGTWELEKIALPFRLASFALTDRDGVMLAAFEQGFASFDLASGEVRWIARPDLSPGVRFNDGRVDPHRQFVAGTMVEDAGAAGSTDLGALYRLSTVGGVQTIHSGIHITNALCWSADGRAMFHADTPTGELKRYDYGGGTPQGGTVITTFQDDALPDGATVDADGCIWVALWGGSRIIRLDADGTELAALLLPAAQPTCPAFGGSDLNCIAVTTAWEGLAEGPDAAPPHAGNLFIFETDFTGRRENRVQLADALFS